MRRVEGRVEPGWKRYPAPAGAGASRRAGVRTAAGSPGRVLSTVVAVAVWLLFCGIAGVTIDLVSVLRAEEASLRQAQADLKDSLTAAQQGLGKDSAPLLLAQVMAAHARAEASAASARMDHDPVLGAARRLPGVGNQVDGAERLNHLVVHAADAAVRGEALVEGLQAARHAPGKPATVDVAGRFYITHQAEVDAVAAEALALPEELKGVDRAALLPPLRQAYEKLDRPLQQVGEQRETVRGLLAAAPVLLGRDQPVKYLLLFADNAELRPGGGFIGTVGVAGFDRGAYTKPDIKTVYTIESGQNKLAAYNVGGSHYVPAPDWLRIAFPQFARHSQTLGNSAQEVFWADDAHLAETLYRSETGSSVNGVIQVDPTTFSYMLRVTGPITVTRGKEPPAEINFANVTDILIGETRTTDKSYLGLFEEQFLARVESLPPAQLGDIFKALRRASEERHLLVYMDHPVLAGIVDRYNLSRPLPPPSADSLLPVFANNAATKADLHTRQAWDITVQPDGRHHVELTLNNRNLGPRTESRFRELIRFYLPPQATAVSLHGFLAPYALFPLLNPGPRDLGLDHGWHLFGGWFRVFSQQTAKLSIDYRLPPVGDEFRLTVLKQPGLGTYPVAVHLLAPGYKAADGGVSHEGSTDWTFYTDRDHTVSAKKP
jgi:hypothetical protein